VAQDAVVGPLGELDLRHELGPDPAGHAGDGVGRLPKLAYRPVNRHLPPRPRRAAEGDGAADPKPAAETLDAAQLNPLLRWLDRALSR